MTQPEPWKCCSLSRSHSHVYENGVEKKVYYTDLAADARLYLETALVLAKEVRWKALTLFLLQLVCVVALVLSGQPIMALVVWVGAFLYGKDLKRVGRTIKCLQNLLKTY